MKTQQGHFLLSLLLLLLFQLQAQSPYDAVYRKSIQTAMYPATNTPDTNLIAITKSNPNLIWKTINGEDYVLVVTWKTQNYYPDSGLYNTGAWSPIWVTTAPELKNRMKKEKYKDVNLRLKQLLGLPPANTTYTVFVEFWVKPSDLFRPCPDREITDKKCELCAVAKNAQDSAYAKWIDNTRLSRYYPCNLYDQYPWTELGYTFDWNPRNKSHIGLCEFVINQNTNVYVKKAWPTEKYLEEK